MFAQVIASCLLLGFVYSLVAIGLTLVWGVMDIINFAHGEFLMIAMYSAFWMYSLVNLDPLVSLPIVAVLVFGVGVLTYKLIIKRVIDAPD